jgi:hypothetical protein
VKFAKPWKLSLDENCLKLGPVTRPKHDSTTVNGFWSSNQNVGIRASAKENVMRLTNATKRGLLNFQENEITEKKEVLQQYNFTVILGKLYSMQTLDLLNINGGTCLY